MRPGLQEKLPCLLVIACLTGCFTLQIPFLSAHDALIILHGYDNFSAELKNKDISINVRFFQRTVIIFFLSEHCRLPAIKP